MKSNQKTKPIILIILGILLAFSSIYFNDPRFTARDRDITSNYNEEFDHENLKISAVSGKIHIDDSNPIRNWSVAKKAGICTGNGTYSEPYVIEDLVIDGGGIYGYCIYIENSDVYFIIEKCTVYNSGYPGAVRLSNVNNSQLINNNCSFNLIGIYLTDSNNNSISGNTAIYNHYSGIGLDNSNNNTISGNTANYNDYEGISFWDSDNNIISGNTMNNNREGMHPSYSDNNNISGNIVNNNAEYGIFLYRSNNNTVSGNILLGNQECIVEEACEGNILENNDCGGGDGRIPGYYLFFLLAILSVVVIIISKKVKKA